MFAWIHTVLGAHTVIPWNPKSNFTRFIVLRCPRVLAEHRPGWSEMLGHSNISITLGLYSHVTPHMQQLAADAMDAALGGE